MFSGSFFDFQEKQVTRGSGEKVTNENLILSQEEGRIRFRVHNVDVNTRPPRSSKPTNLERAWLSLGKGPIHHMTPLPHGKEVFQVFTEHNSFAEAVHRAFFEHYPLRITPDAVWITILQGVAIHVNEHSEELRHKFVAHEGKKELLVIRPRFPETGEEWESGIDEFTSLIRGNVFPQILPLIDSRFSTTTKVDQTVMNIAVMDMNKCYFEYSMVCGCGIPWIELLGTAQDWQVLREKVESLRFLGLDAWLDALTEVLGHFERAVKGDIGDGSFWRSVVFLMGGSGMIGDPITGWLQAFFPYLQGQRNEFYLNHSVNSWKKDQLCSRNPSRSQGYENGRRADAVSLKNIPSGISQAPVFIQDLLNKKKYDMIFAGGLTGVVRGSDGALEVTTGYAILEK